MDDELKELACQMLSNLNEEFQRYERCNKLIRDIEPDFPATMFPINGILSARLVDMLDYILGDTIASYFLYDAPSKNMGGGKIFETDGKEWPINSIEDVRAYVFRDKPTPSQKNEGGE